MVGLAVETKGRWMLCVMRKRIATQALLGGYAEPVRARRRNWKYTFRKSGGIGSQLQLKSERREKPEKQLFSRSLITVYKPPLEAEL